LNYAGDRQAALISGESGFDVLFNSASCAFARLHKQLSNKKEKPLRIKCFDFSFLGD
jgi:hypothetical protein